MREDTEHIISSGKTPLHSFLSEPPHIRERLIKEINFFVSHLKREAANKMDLNPATHSDLIKYVTGTSNVGRCRPQSAISARDGRETPLRAKDERYGALPAGLIC